MFITQQAYLSAERRYVAGKWRSTIVYLSCWKEHNSNTEDQENSSRLKGP